MTIIFIDAPPGVSSGSAPGYPSESVARLHISVHWKAWLASGNTFPSASSSPVGIYDLARGLAENNRHFIPFSSCRHLIDCFAEEDGPNTCFRRTLFKSSQRFKSMASEHLALAASIESARRQGLGYLGDRKDLNALFGLDIWIKPWDGDGPDMLFANATGDVTFMEVKGRLTADKSAGTKFAVTKRFLDEKIQSINAEIKTPLWMPVPKPSLRYVLSVVGRGADDQITVQWFNQRSQELPEEAHYPHSPLILAAAHSHFVRLLRSLKLSIPKRGTRVGTVRYYQRSKKEFLANGLRGQFQGLLVDRDLLRLFKNIRDWFHELRSAQYRDLSIQRHLKEADQLLFRLRALEEQHPLRTELERLRSLQGRTLHAFPFGLVLISE